MVKKAGLPVTTIVSSMYLYLYLLKLLTKQPPIEKLAQVQTLVITIGTVTNKVIDRSAGVTAPRVISRSLGTVTTGAVGAFVARVTASVAPQG